LVGGRRNRKKMVYLYRGCCCVCGGVCGGRAEETWRGGSGDSLPRTFPTSPFINTLPAIKHNSSDNKQCKVTHNTFKIKIGPIQDGDWLMTGLKIRIPPPTANNTQLISDHWSLRLTLSLPVPTTRHPTPSASFPLPFSNHSFDFKLTRRQFLAEFTQKNLQKASLCGSVGKDFVYQASPMFLVKWL